MRRQREQHQHHWRGAPNFRLRRIRSALLSGSPALDAELESVEAVLGMVRCEIAACPHRCRLLLVLFALLRPSPCLEALLLFCSLCQMSVSLQTDYYHWQCSHRNLRDSQCRKQVQGLGGHVAAQSSPAPSPRWLSTPYRPQLTVLEAEEADRLVWGVPGAVLEALYIGTNMKFEFEKKCTEKLRTWRRIRQHGAVLARQCCVLGAEARKNRHIGSSSGAK